MINKILRSPLPVANCNQNNGFKPIASGGNGATIQYWYVGYDTTLQVN